MFEQLFREFWWLIFPLFGMVTAIIYAFIGLFRQQEVIRILKIYAERGEQPPEALLRRLNMEDDESSKAEVVFDDDMCRGGRRFKVYGWKHRPEKAWGIQSILVGGAFFIAGKFSPFAVEVQWTFYIIGMILALTGLSRFIGRLFYVLGNPRP